jgi:hypothetical protein
MSLVDDLLEQRLNLERVLGVELAAVVDRGFERPRRRRLALRHATRQQ